jgi:hypothetical protein
MSKEEEGRVWIPFLNPPVDKANIIGNSKKAVPVGGVARKSAAVGAIHSETGGIAMPPLIRRPDLEPFNTEPPGQRVVAEGMFRHPMNQVDYRPLFFYSPRRKPAPEKKQGAVIGGNPIFLYLYRSKAFLTARSNHVSIVPSLLSFLQS